MRASKRVDSCEKDKVQNGRDKRWISIGGGKGGKTTNKRLEEVEEEGREEMSLKHFLR